MESNQEIYLTKLCPTRTCNVCANKHVHICIEICSVCYTQRERTKRQTETGKSEKQIRNTNNKWIHNTTSVQFPKNLPAEHIQL